MFDRDQDLEEERCEECNTLEPGRRWPVRCGCCGEVMQRACAPCASYAPNRGVCRQCAEHVEDGRGLP